MDVTVTKDSVGAIFPDGVSIDKNEVNAKVLVSDGETIVIGGVFSNTQTKSVDKVPFWVTSHLLVGCSSVTPYRRRNPSC